MNDKTKAIAALGVAGTIVLGSAVEYVNVMRTERKKRKQIKEWETMNLECISNSLDRLTKILNDGDLDAFYQADREEAAFLNIVRNQSPYDA
jgi:hypothetical protein